MALILAMPVFQYDFLQSSSEEQVMAENEETCDRLKQLLRNSLIPSSHFAVRTVCDKSGKRIEHEWRVEILYNSDLYKFAYVDLSISQAQTDLMEENPHVKEIFTHEQERYEIAKRVAEEFADCIDVENHNIFFVKNTVLETNKRNRHSITISDKVGNTYYLNIE